MPVLLFTADEVARSLLNRQRELAREVRELADLDKKPLDPGESVAARHHKLAKLGKQLADAFDQFDTIMGTLTESEKPAEAEPPTTNPQAN